jgi:hypothetical protein
VAWSWERGQERHVVVSQSEVRAQGRVPLPWPDLAGQPLRLIDSFTGETYDRDGGETTFPGLFVDLPAWGFHLLTAAGSATFKRRQTERRS